MTNSCGFWWFLLFFLESLLRNLLQWSSRILHVMSNHPAGPLLMVSLPSYCPIRVTVSTRLLSVLTKVSLFRFLRVWWAFTSQEVWQLWARGWAPPQVRRQELKHPKVEKTSLDHVSVTFGFNLKVLLFALSFISKTIVSLLHFVKYSPPICILFILAYV